MRIEKLKEYVENIEQLGADVRYKVFYTDNIDKADVKILLESIEHWAKKGLNELKKEEK